MVVKTRVNKALTLNRKTANHPEESYRIRRTTIRRIERSGWMIIATAIILGIAGVNSGNNMLYLIDGLLLATLLASGQVSRHGLKATKVHVQAPERVWSESLTKIRLNMDMTGFAWFLSGVEIFLEWTRSTPKQVPSRRAKSMGYQLKNVVLLPKHHRRVNLAWAFNHRGRYQLDKVTIGTTGPFGWFYRIGWFKTTTDVIVYPACWPNWQEPFQSTQTDALTVHVQESSLSDDFIGLRSYQPGDSLRRIHWPTSARIGSWMVRQSGQTETNQIRFYLDRRMDVETLEIALSWIATGLDTLFHRGQPVSLWTQGWSPIRIVNSSSFHATLTFLATCEPTNQSVQPLSEGLPGYWISSTQFPPSIRKTDILWIHADRLKTAAPTENPERDQNHAT